MAQQTISTEIGGAADTLPAAMQKVNANFGEIYAAVATKSDAATTLDLINGKASLSGAVFIGDVVIQKAAPAVILDKQAGQSAIIYCRQSDGWRWRVILGSNAAESGANAGSDLRFDRYSDDGITLLGYLIAGTRSTGYVGINTNAPVDRLDVNGNLVPHVDNAYTCGKSGYRWSSVWAATGTIQTSDVRHKTAIADSGLGLSFIAALRPVSYKWIVGSNVVTMVDDPDNPIVDRIEDPGSEAGYREVSQPGKREVVTPLPGTRTHYGLLAQEVKAALASVGCSDFAGYIKTDPADPESEEGLRYDQFIAPLIKAVQELAARIDVLERA